MNSMHQAEENKHYEIVCVGCVFKYEKYLSLFICQRQVGVESLKTQWGRVNKKLDRHDYDFFTYLFNFPKALVSSPLKWEY